MKDDHLKLLLGFSVSSLPRERVRDPFQTMVGKKIISPIKSFIIQPTSSSVMLKSFLIKGHPSSTPTLVIRVKKCTKEHKY